MPVYVYSCPKCVEVDVYQPFADEPLDICPQCGSEIKRKIKPVAIKFKGSGFYVNDGGE